jgi:hypothetical protein
VEGSASSRALHEGMIIEFSLSLSTLCFYIFVHVQYNKVPYIVQVIISFGHLVTHVHVHCTIYMYMYVEYYTIGGVYDVHVCLIFHVRLLSLILSARPRSHLPLLLSPPSHNSNNHHHHHHQQQHNLPLSLGLIRYKN